MCELCDELQGLLLDELAKARLCAGGWGRLSSWQVVGANARELAASWNLPGAGSLGLCCELLMVVQAHLM